MGKYMFTKGGKRVTGVDWHYLLDSGCQLRDKIFTVDLRPIRISLIECCAFGSVLCARD
jgi:hypothetical protein